MKHNKPTTKADLLRKLDADFRDEQSKFVRIQTAYNLSKYITEKYGTDELYFEVSDSYFVDEGLTAYTVFPRFVDEKLPVTKKLQLLLAALPADRKLDRRHQTGTRHEYYQVSTDRHCNNYLDMKLSVGYRFSLENLSTQSKYVMFFSEDVTPEIVETNYFRYRDSVEMSYTQYDEKGKKPTHAPDYLLKGTTEGDYQIFGGGSKVLSDDDKVDDLLYFIQHYGE